MSPALRQFFLITIPNENIPVSLSRWPDVATSSPLGPDSVGLDVSAPANPQLLGQLDTAGEAAGIFVTNGIAYVADGSAGLVLIDVSNPNLPTRINSLRFGGYSKAVEVANGLAFVAGGESGLHVIDVSTSSSLQRLGGISASSGRSYGVTLAGSVAYVADLYLGLQIYDISTPSQPRLISDPIFTLEGYTVELVGTRAYLADGLAAFWRSAACRLPNRNSVSATAPESAASGLRQPRSSGQERPGIE